MFVLSGAFKLGVLKAGPEWQLLAVNDFDDTCHATPAIVDNTIYIYVRTRSALFAFGTAAAAAR